MFEEFESFLRQQDRSPETVSAYTRDIRGFAVWFQSTNQEELTPNLLTNTDVKQYKYYLLKQEAAPNTINRKLIAIRNYCKWAKYAGKIDFDPTAEIKPIKQQELSPKWLGKKEQYAILRTLERNIHSSKTSLQKQNAIRDKAIVTILLQTGLRTAELCDLKISDISISDRKGNVAVRHGKGLKARNVPLNEIGRNALRDWLKIRPITESKSLFTGKGHGLQKRAVQDIIEKIGLDARCPFSSRQLRSSFAKNLLEAQVTIEKISALMGHNNLNTTRLYIIPSFQDLEVATDALTD
jgi:site-specific recombinase XerD